MLNRAFWFMGGAPKELLLVFTGESNTGGRALNSLATTAEKASTSSVKILNNTSLTSFDDLAIGVNNIIDHAGLNPDTTEHSWELQLIQRVIGGTFNTNPTYLVKAGQGGTKIADWYVGATTYLGVNVWQKLQDRVDAAIALRQAAGKSPQVVFFYQQGINDSLNGTNITTWTNDTIAHFAKIRVKYPGSIIIFLKIPAAFSGYSTAIDNVIAGSGANTYSVSSNGATMGIDSNHYSYSGQKQNANTLIEKLLSLGLSWLSGTPIPAASRLIWSQISGIGVSDNGDGTINLGLGSNSGATATKQLTNVPSYVQMTRPSSGSNAVVLYLTTANDGNYSYGSLAGIGVGVYEFSGLYYYYQDNAAAVSTGRTPVTGDIIRLERVNVSDVILKISSDSGVTFTTITTWTGKFSAGALTVKGFLAAGGTSSKLNLGFGYNQS